MDDITVETRQINKYIKKYKFLDKKRNTIFNIYSCVYLKGYHIISDQFSDIPKDAINAMKDRGMKKIIFTVNSISSNKILEKMKETKMIDFKRSSGENLKLYVHEII